jgi:hypothetical protein
MKYEVHKESKKNVPIIQHRIWKPRTKRAARIGMQQVGIKILKQNVLEDKTSGSEDILTDTNQIR